MATLGKLVAKSRKDRGLTQEELGELVNLSKGAIWKIENDDLKGGPDPCTVKLLSDVLKADEILYKYLEENPVYLAIIPKIFPDLNNIRRDPAIIFTRLAREAEEARDAALILAEVFSNADPRRVDGFEQIFKANMEQLVDFKRGVEIAETQLVASHVLSQSGLKDIYLAQQAKCEANGHHVPEQRTGTEG